MLVCVLTDCRDSCLSFMVMCHTLNDVCLHIGLLLVRTDLATTVYATSRISTVLAQASPTMINYLSTHTTPGGRGTMHGSWFHRMQDVPPSITELLLAHHCPHLVLQVRIGPSAQQELYHLVMTFEAGSCQCCLTNLYGGMSESNHEMVLQQLTAVHLGMIQCLY